MHNDFIMHVFIMHVARTSLMHNNLIMHVFVMQFKNKKTAEKLGEDWYYFFIYLKIKQVYRL